jgi:hypothetical protein
MGNLISSRSAKITVEILTANDAHPQIHAVAHEVDMCQKIFKTWEQELER